MGLVAIRRNAWDAGNAGQRAALRFAARKVELGGPAVYVQPNGTEWFIFLDQGIDLLDVAILGTVAAGLATFPGWVPPADKALAREQVYDFVKDNVVLPRNVALTEIVQVEVPVRIQVEVFDENGDPFDPPVFVWQDHPTDTQLIDVEQSLGDSFRLVVEAQGAPSWMTARESLPAGLTPKEDN